MIYSGSKAINVEFKDQTEVSVLLSELFVGGTISFGALIAGLSTGAGFGYIVLFQDKEGRRRALPVIAATFVVAVLGGMLVQVFYG